MCFGASPCLLFRHCEVYVRMFMFRSLLSSICHDFIWNRANAAQRRFNMRAVAEFALIFQFNKLMKKNHSCVN